MLKLKKQLSSEAPWRGHISFRDQELELRDAAQVEQEIHKGRAPVLAGGGPGRPLTAPPPPFLLGGPQRHMQHARPAPAAFHGPVPLSPRPSPPFSKPLFFLWV